MLLAGLAGTVICAALLVREAALAADRTVVWSAPHWWHDLLTAPAALVALAGAAAAVLGIGCLWFALRMLGGGEPDEGAGIELGIAPTSVLVRPRRSNDCWPTVSSTRSPRSQTRACG